MALSALLSSRGRFRVATTTETRITGSTTCASDQNYNLTCCPSSLRISLIRRLQRYNIYVCRLCTTPEIRWVLFQRRAIPGHHSAPVSDRQIKTKFRSTRLASPKEKLLKILVLGNDSQSFLTVVRSLGRAGHEIHVAWHVESSAAVSSRYIVAKHKLAPYRADDSSWPAEFQGLLSTNQIDLVVPCHDSVILPLQAVQGKLAVSARLYTLPQEIYQVVNSKIKMYQIAGDLFIPVAKGATITSKEEGREALNALTGPWVFKPDFSYSSGQLSTHNSVKKSFRMEQALRLVPEFLSLGKFQIQQNFIGVGTGVEVLCERGEVLLEFQHVRVHEPLHGGGSSYRKGIPLHPGMRDATKKLMTYLQYTGVAMVEFKWNQSNDEWIFIELNARFWGSLPLAVASGANFPLALVELLMFGKRPARDKIRSDLYARNLTRDIGWLATNVRADKRNPALCSLPATAVLKEALQIVRGKERWDSLVLDDPAPFLREISLILTSKTRALVRRIVCSRAYLAATKTWRRARLQKKMLTARNIGFVCYGNICRSPFAEVHAQKSMPRIHFFSAGFHPSERRPSPEDAITAANTLGVDLSTHKSRLLLPEAAQMADVLFVFDRSNLRQMHFSFSGAISKTFLLSDMCAAQGLEVEDPWGHDIGVFSQTYRTIQSCIDALASI